MGAMFCAAVLSSPVFAGVITYGTLTTDTAGNTITDTSTGRMYSRFDAFNLSYADTFAMIADPLSDFFGWSVADSGINDDFINALFGTAGTNPCTVGTDAYNEVCGTLGGWSDGALGNAFDIYSDYYAFLNTTGATTIGLTLISSFDDTIYEFNDWSTISNLDYFGSIDGLPFIPINLLLYKDGTVSSVPTPSPLAIIGFGLLGLFGTRKLHWKAQF